jgi:GIY-YIG catalytic domain
MSSRSSKPRRVVYVYLLCLATKFYHCRHYLGSSVDPDRRLREHRSGNGSHFTRAVAAAGIEMEIVRLWPGERYDEVLLKLHKNAAKYCPRCREEFLRRDRIRRKAKRDEKRALKIASEMPIAA